MYAIYNHHTNMFEAYDKNHDLVDSMMGTKRSIVNARARRATMRSLIRRAWNKAMSHSMAAK